jgi:hypothetical protein
MKDYVDTVRTRQPVAGLDTIDDYVPAAEHNLINFAERQARRRRRMQARRPVHGDTPPRCGVTQEPRNEYSK